MNIISQDDLKNISFDSVRVFEEGDYRRFQVTKDGVVSDYYLPITKPVIQEEVVDMIPPIDPVHRVDIPDFMKRRQQEMMKKQKPLSRPARTENQEKVFAFFLQNALNKDNGGNN
jgi:hypothetical protein